MFPELKISSKGSHFESLEDIEQHCNGTKGFFCRAERFKCVYEVRRWSFESDFTHYRIVMVFLSNRINPVTWSPNITFCVLCKNCTKWTH